MATGSRRWFQYNDDNDVGYAIQLDESTAETLPLGFRVIDATVAASGRVIRRGYPVNPRYILISRLNEGEVETRKVFVGSIAADAWGATTVTIDGSPWTITYRHGERQQYIPPVDTAKKDGDTDSNIAGGPALPAG